MRPSLHDRIIELERISFNEKEFIEYQIYEINHDNINYATNVSNQFTRAMWLIREVLLNTSLTKYKVEYHHTLGNRNMKSITYSTTDYEYRYTLQGNKMCCIIYNPICGEIMSHFVWKHVDFKHLSLIFTPEIDIWKCDTGHYHFSSVKFEELNKYNEICCAETVQAARRYFRCYLDNLNVTEYIDNGFLIKLNDIRQTA